MINLSKINKLILFCLFLLFLTGCEAKETLKNVNEKLGEFFKESQEKNQEGLINIFDKKEIEKEGIDAKDLTDEQKEKIDVWLEKNGYNRYGDPGGIIYTGGTPLFNEATGESMDRLEYILKNHPQILDVIK
ncbi:hypothetical protein A2331_01270 [Candidatus Falkowbacteria bacterium RIFOXYB2_FULL_34_18]|uniref:Lipoprotein n=1 Tax=Candidatus Falkowbacteria bacterium RIFOXYD2_FULL_34_120 TaxID=1798007 RepID=A0A1F5TPC7_9BACT|nr:MAG: hypothetical protein A2331_01270 [Candidatus Falkowbacteria bacterium RIFOXYB2_FULL_34_18]OGF29248.1 MAG: hypothetical protein A2500_05150 [Candidatus Falkowbacteria bacterium RIFOXYC12_FULL_34_55]OGF36364.1 MAG: hypothetical protein A2466_00810 [Candidatus Falkowbacteria bacterium RIFOXYC2_FULL_34_220]OGF38843.1 MAG: hypothetical protein A2515_05570 [Candidatus Falkowbacteria bacterium RIFOXYD12_FULL_34_57]OGF40862.1 MAG: hypothetical protein A2531_03795 [Candidatus Falkowbacteria bact